MVEACAWFFLWLFFMAKPGHVTTYGKNIFRSTGMLVVFFLRFGSTGQLMELWLIMEWRLRDEMDNQNKNVLTFQQINGRNTLKALLL